MVRVRLRLSARVRVRARVRARARVRGRDRVRLAPCLCGACVGSVQIEELAPALPRLLAAPGLAIG